METVPARKAARRSLPSGKVAFLFTDIVGSTVRWEHDTEAMRDDVRAHDRIMRSAIQAHHGHVFKTVGDAFCAVFAQPGDAVAAAAQAQQSLNAYAFSNEGGLAVRMAVHVGEADERDDDYFGPSLNRIARLLAIGHGGQVLISGSAAEAVEDAGVTLRDLGNHRLKDLTAPEHVFQLLGPDLATEFPHLQSLSVLSNNLPQQITPLIGREEDLTQIKERIRTSRIVTLSGAGGVGKTRCALQAGAELLEQYTDGVWFVDLARISDPALVAITVARVFELQESPGQSALETLTTHLKSKSVLLILDNCEHVLGECSVLAGKLLASCAGVRILATSREALNISGETLYRMPSLNEEASVALFEQRGKSVQPRFAITEQNTRTVAAICRRLDGIPLAIELAAARLRVLTPAQLLEKLNERFRVLTGGDRSALPRQQTMRALIDWSYDLLGSSEQSVFRRLSVFCGGFTMETATALCVDETFDEMDVLAVLSSLTDKSLIHTEHAEESVRYRLLESTREYAAEKLQANREHTAARQRHAEIFADLAETLDARYEESNPAVWLDEAQADLENLRTALSWAFSEQGDPLVGQRIAVTLPRLFGVLAPAEGLRWVMAAIERIGQETPAIVAAGLHLAHASFASIFNQFSAALSAGQEAVNAYVSLARPISLADAQRIVGRSLLYLGRVDEGESMLNEALAARQASGSLRIGGILGDLAVARALGGDLNAARTLFARASAMFQEGADASKLAITAATLAEAEFMAGDPEAAIHLAEEALENARAVGRHRTAAAVLGNIAAYEIELQRYDQAKLHARESLQLCREAHGDIVSVLCALQNIAVAGVMTPTDDAARAALAFARAAGLIGFIDARLRALDVQRQHTEQVGYEKLIKRLYEELDGEEAAMLIRAGANWSEERAVAEADAL